MRTSLRNKESILFYFILIIINNFSLIIINFDLIIKNVFTDIFVISLKKGSDIMKRVATFLKIGEKKVKSDS